MLQFRSAELKKEKINNSILTLFDSIISSFMCFFFFWENIISQIMN